MSDNNIAPGPGATSTSTIMGISQHRGKNLGTSKLWLEKYLLRSSNEGQTHTNTNYSHSLSLIAKKHVEEDHLAFFIEAAGFGLSSHSFWTRKNTRLGKRARVEFFRSRKDILKKMFPHHPFLMGNQDSRSSVSSQLVLAVIAKTEKRRGQKCEFTS